MANPNPTIEEVTTLTPNGAEVRIVYVYEGVILAPEVGSDWPDTHDRHIVSVRIELPRDANNPTSRPPWLRVSSTIFGEVAFRDASFHTTVISPGVAEAYNECRRLVKEALTPLREHAAAREARLLVRNQRLQEGRKGSPFTHND